MQGRRDLSFLALDDKKNPFQQEMRRETSDECVPDVSFHSLLFWSGELVESADRERGTR